ncbi:MAG: DUF2157 domain-containing protein [Pseudomonadota bacterium]
MNKRAYLQRLRGDMERWVTAGWIDASLGDKMVADAGAQSFREEGSSPILPGLAGLIIIFGLLTVIAANWAELSGVIRLGLLFGLLALSLFGAGETRARGLGVASNLLSIFAAAFAGGGLVVIGQLYHTGSTTSEFLSVWTLMATGVALALRSPLTMAGALALGILWTVFHFDNNPFNNAALLDGPLWLIPVWALALFRAYGDRSLGLVHLTIISVIIWIMPTLVDLVDAAGGRAPALLRMALVWGVIAGLAEATARATGLWASRTTAGWTTWVAGAFLAMAAAAERIDPTIFGGIGLAVIALAIFSALTAYGAAPGRRWLRGAGVAGFIAVSLIFFSMSGNLLVAGVTMIVFGAALIALLLVTNKRLQRAQQEARA